MQPERAAGPGTDGGKWGAVIGIARQLIEPEPSGRMCLLLHDLFPAMD